MAPRKNSTQKNRLYVLDTNVLMHDPTALFRFHEHDIYIPLVVLEELDNAKKGLSEVSRNVRQTSRFLDEMITDVDKDDINRGLSLSNCSYTSSENFDSSGKVFLQTDFEFEHEIKNVLGGKADNKILSVTAYLQQTATDKEVILVSKDINLRIKAKAIGLQAEDYFNDNVLDDVDLLHRGISSLEEDFWDKHSQEMESWQDEGRTFYRVHGPSITEWVPNEFIFLDDESNFEARVKKVDKESAVIETAQDYRNVSHSIWGITARNREQNCALNLLMDPDIDFVTLLGQAGTGKTLLTLAAGLVQVLELNRYREMIVTRVTVPVGEDIGFLPGTEEEKMTPWMGALLDNLEVLTKSSEGGEWGRAATNDLLTHRIKIRSLNFMRGRTFLNKYIIVDEAQNLTAKQMKTLITRAGPGTKVICLGNVAQIDTPYLTETSSGLTYVVERFRNWEYAGHITLLRGERSRLADFAADNL